jgi:hypothetical protein
VSGPHESPIRWILAAGLREYRSGEDFSTIAFPADAADGAGYRLEGLIREGRLRDYADVAQCGR